MTRTWTRTCLLALMLSAVACGGDQFTQQHYDLLQKDCSETLRCRSGSIEFASADALESCVSSTADRLAHSSEAKQNEFVQTVNRCSQLQVCDYQGCAQSDPNTGYAALHHDMILYDCSQQVACRVQNGLSTATTAVDDCLNQASNMLNFGTPQVQAAFEQKAARCAGQLSCNWVACQ